MSDVTYPISGACQCGQVTYSLLAPPKMVVACHCKECQKLSTSAFSMTAMVDRKDLVVDGELSEWQRPADSGNISAAKFCPGCGNRIYHYNPAEPDAIKLKPSTLSDTRDLDVKVHVWVSEKQDWYQIPEGATVVDKQP